jgi:uncharacterized protein YndB with AHSA1/START domain
MGIRDCGNCDVAINDDDTMIDHVPEAFRSTQTARGNIMKKLTYSITINKPVQVVFGKLVDKSVYPAWAKAWGEGMTYEGEWKEGQHISFFDKTQGGTKALVESVVPNEMIRLRHVAMVNPQNVEVALTDDMMRAWIGSREEYYLTSEGDDGTKFEVVMLTDEAFEGMMNAWIQALQLFKDICEA